MSSLILSVLGLDASDLFYSDRINLYHSGDSAPFANLVFKDGKVSLRVNSGETLDRSASIYLGHYGKH